MDTPRQGGSCLPLAPRPATPPGVSGPRGLRSLGILLTVLFSVFALLSAGALPVHAAGGGPAGRSGVIAWGYNGKGQTNVSVDLSGVSHVVAVAAGGFDSLAMILA